MKSDNRTQNCIRHVENLVTGLENIAFPTKLSNLNWQNCHPRGRPSTMVFTFSSITIFADSTSKFQGTRTPFLPGISKILEVRLHYKLYKNSSSLRSKHSRFRIPAARKLGRAKSRGRGWGSSTFCSRPKFRAATTWKTFPSNRNAC